MDKTFFKIGLLALLALLAVGCNGYNKLLKSKNPELMFSKAIEYYDAKKYSRTIQLLEEVTHYYSGTMRDDSVAYYMGAAHYKSGDFESSGILLNEFRQTYTMSPFLEDVEYMYAKGFYYSSAPANRDQIATKQALVAIDEYIERYPKSAKKEVMQENVTELTQKLHDKVFINAKSYYMTGKYKAATMALKNAINKYPDSSHREEILYLTTKSNYLLAFNSIESLQRDRYLDMMDAYYNFVSEYPQSKHIKEVDKMQEEAKAYTAKFKDLENTEVQNGD